MRFFCFLVFICSFSATAQPPCTSFTQGGTAQTSNPVCGALVFSQTSLPACTGPDLPPSGCTDAVSSASSIWYSIHIYNSGTLGFLITPNNPADDYDWQLMDITNRQPADVYTTNLRVSLNLSAATGATGCSSVGTVDLNCAGPTPRFNRLLPVVAGSDYLLMVTRFSSSGTQGYNLSFTGGTAVITNVLPPSVTSVAQVGCNPSQIRVNFSEDILCSSLTTAGTEFTISNGTHVITSVTSACSSSANAFTTLTLNLQNPLPPGSYTLTVNNGSDGNTLLDVCNDPMLPNVPVAFTIPPQTPPTITQVTKANCTGSILKVALSQQVLCSSISANGSEFSITPGSPTINAVTTNCSGTVLSTDTIFINLQNPLTDGSYTLTINNGADGNTVIDNCGLPVAAGSTRAFSITTTPAPTVTNPPPYCQGATATALQATGINLLWYANATGGTGSTTAAVPSTTNAGTFNFYVSQTLSNCEGPRAVITVNVNPSPTPPTASPAIFNYCAGQTATMLNATGSNILWYTTATGGTGSSTAPTPSTASVGATMFYASQTISGCQSPTRVEVTVNVTAVPSAPAVTSPLVFCQGSPTVQLTATGTNLLWYNSSTGGTGSATAPTPSTAALGSTNYFVSQTNVGSASCEGPRAQITVNIVTTPAAPVVTLH